MALIASNTFLLPSSVYLYEKEWNPRRELAHSQTECFKIAELLGAHAVVGDEAIKDRFLKEVQEATVVHIGRLANTRSSLINKLLKLILCSRGQISNFQLLFASNFC